MVLAIADIKTDVDESLFHKRLLLTIGISGITYHFEVFIFGGSPRFC